MEQGNDYGVHDIAPAHGVKSISKAQFHATDPIGQGMRSTLERNAYIWHSRRTLGANTGAAQTRTTGIGMTFGRSEGTN